MLGAALVPGPDPRRRSGVLFGAAVGTLVTIAAATLGAVIALHIARRSAGDAYQTLSGPRMQGLADFAERHGLAAVIVARLAPVRPRRAGRPTSSASSGLRTWKVALGTAIGAAPRAFSYTSIGASLDDPSSPLALAGIAGVVLTGLIGLVLSRRLLGEVLVGAAGVDGLADPAQRMDVRRRPERDVALLRRGRGSSRSRRPSAPPGARRPPRRSTAARCGSAPTRTS